MGSTGEQRERLRYGGYEEIREERRLKIVGGSRHLKLIARQNVDLGPFFNGLVYKKPENGPSQFLKAQWVFLNVLIILTFI